MSRPKKSKFPKYKVNWIVYLKDPAGLSPSSKQRVPSWVLEMDKYCYTPCVIHTITQTLDDTWVYKVSTFQRSYLTHKLDLEKEIIVPYTLREEWLEEGDLKNWEQIERDTAEQRVKGILDDWKK